MYRVSPYVNSSEVKERIESLRPVSKYSDGVKIYALELLDRIVGDLRERDAERDTTHLPPFPIPGADLPAEYRDFMELAQRRFPDWESYIRAGFALKSGREVANRLGLRKFEWSDIDEEVLVVAEQSRALKCASDMLYDEVAALRYMNMEDSKKFRRWRRLMREAGALEEEGDEISVSDS